MTAISLEALYTISLMNNQAKRDDIPLIPLPTDLKLGRKETLKVALTKGYKELEALGFLTDEVPSEAFIATGLKLDAYLTADYHVVVDERHFIAPAVDTNGWCSVVITLLDDGTYVLDYLNSVFLLGYLIRDNPVLENLDKQEKNYLKSLWSPYMFSRLMAFYGDKPSLRICREEAGRLLSDEIFIQTDKSGLLQYDLTGERIRSLSPDEIKEYINDYLKVKVEVIS
ncbi:hypothetical protein [Streptococcus sp. DD12]|uniref:hypothetical protein n=1 Tax=Streptococcus sp. DD12 TaxID=1777880 RepID=UPI00079B176C|nr:hypothetical protein [Streptococcus sp. DD12]KXT75902.1 hypothetical protein STRDD12_01014 [Streptococcus sp. DD12]